MESVGYSESAFDTLIFGTNTLRFCQFSRELAVAAPFFATRNIQLGPQVHLPAGRYEVTFTGQRLLGANFLATHSEGEHHIDIFDLYRSDNIVKFSFTLESNERQIEFLKTNNIFHLAEVNKIQVRIAERLPINRITFADLIHFDRENHAYDRFYLRGLSEQEETGVWSSGHRTEFMFCVPYSPNDLVFSFTAQPLTGYGLEVQWVEFEVNGTTLAVWEISQSGTYEILIPNSLFPDNSLHIAFILPTATTPKELRINEDERVLALFFEKMMFNAYF